MKLFDFDLSNLAVGEYEAPFIPTRLRHAVVKLCQEISNCRKIKDGDSKPSIVEYDSAAGLIRVYRPLAEDFSNIDAVMKWKIVCNLLANPETSQFATDCSDSFISSVRNFFSHHGLTVSICRAKDGRVTFGTRRAVSKSDRIRDRIATAIAKGSVTISEGLRDISFIRVVVSREAAKHSAHDFSVSVVDDSVIIKADRKDPRKERAAHLLSIIMENTKNTRGVTEFDRVTSELREIMYGSDNSAAALV
jgi:hypothetical protein